MKMLQIPHDAGPCINNQKCPESVLHWLNLDEVDIAIHQDNELALHTQTGIYRLKGEIAKQAAKKLGIKIKIKIEISTKKKD